MEPNIIKRKRDFGVNMKNQGSPTLKIRFIKIDTVCFEHQSVSQTNSLITHTHTHTHTQTHTHTHKTYAEKGRE